MLRGRGQRAAGHRTRHHGPDADRTDVSAAWTVDVDVYCNDSIATGKTGSVRVLADGKLVSTINGTVAESRYLDDRFYRADSGRAGPGGRRLGLSIARTVVEPHGGTIDAQSGPGPRHHPTHQVGVKLRTDAIGDRPAARLEDPELTSVLAEVLEVDAWT